MKGKTTKLLEENVGGNLGDLALAMSFGDTTLKAAQSMKEKIDKLDFIKIKNFCSVKDTVTRLNRQVRGWEDILAKTYLSVCIANVQRTLETQQ